MSLLPWPFLQVCSSLALAVASVPIPVGTTGAQTVPGSLCAVLLHGPSSSCHPWSQSVGDGFRVWPPFHCQSLPPAGFCSSVSSAQRQEGKGRVCSAAPPPDLPLGGRAACLLRVSIWGVCSTWALECLSPSQCSPSPLPLCPARRAGASGLCWLLVSRDSTISVVTRKGGRGQGKCRAHSSHHLMISSS